MNQFGPQGSITYAQNGTWADGTPRFTQTTSLSPSQQKIFDAMQGAQGNLANLAQTQSNRLGDILAEPFSLDNDATEARLMELGSKRLDPLLDRRRREEEARLANRGIRLGSDAYSEAIEGVNQAENDAYNQLLLTGRNQAIQEALLERQTPLNEIIGVASGTQVQNPAYAGTPQTGVAGTDIAGINQGVYNGQLAQYGADMNQWNSTMGGLFGLGANAMLAFSDKTLKTNIEPTGEKVGGVRVVEYDRKDTGAHEVGVIAQELEKKHPELVHRHPSGKRMVDYGGLMRLGASAKRAA